MTSDLRDPMQSARPPWPASETWNYECRRCGFRRDSAGRGEAHAAGLEHIAATGHIQDGSISGRFEVWKSEGLEPDDERGHLITIGLPVRVDGTFPDV